VSTIAARKEKGALICENIGSVLHSTNNFILHVVFIFSSFPGNHNLEGHILPVTGQPDSGETAMAKFMLYTVCLNEHLPNSNRIE
jgi:hypothetical protein